jgi:hypothetical protein
LGELWDLHWKYDMTNNFILESGSTPRPAGSEITISGANFTTPYNINSSPISIPTISSNDAYIINPKAWHAPNPTWYIADGGSMTGQNQDPVVCFLSRLQEKTSTYDPIVYEPAGNSTNIDPYVRNNNNVATRNSALVDGPQFSTIGGSGGTSISDFHTVIANNPSAGPTRICLRNISAVDATVDHLLNYGEVQIGFTNGIWNNWVASGMNGSGFTVVSPTLIRVTDPNQVCFDNINIGNNMQEQLGVRIIWDLEACYPVDSPMFRYALQQENMESAPNYRGSDVVFMFPAHGEQCQNEGLRMGSSSTTLLNNKTVESKEEVKKSSKRNSTSVDQNLKPTVILYPNPANHETILTIDQVDESTTLNAYDATGKRIQLDFEKTYVNGVVVFKINTQNLVNGVYILETRNTNFISSNRLIIQK